MEKVCPGCPEKGPQSVEHHFYVSTKCRCCTRGGVRANYAENIDHRHAYDRQRNKTERRKQQMNDAGKRHCAANPMKRKARLAVGAALKSGSLVKGACAYCGSTTRVEAHHSDYTKPLDVTWACFKCHREHEHGQVTSAEQALGITKNEGSGTGT